MLWGVGVGNQAPCPVPLCSSLALRCFEELFLKEVLLLPSGQPFQVEELFQLFLGNGYSIITTLLCVCNAPGVIDEEICLDEKTEAQGGYIPC